MTLNTAASLQRKMKWFPFFFFFSNNLHTKQIKRRGHSGGTLEHSGLKKLLVSFSRMPL